MYTHSGTVGQRMTGAVMRETETLYSALGKKGRMGAGGSEGGREKCLGLHPFLPFTLSYVSLSLSSSPPTPPFLRSLSPTSRDAHSFGIWGCAHIHTQSLQECVCVCGLVKWQNGAEASQTCMWGCLGYSILVHLCSFFVLSFFFFLNFLFFYYCYFLILFEYFWFLVQKKNHTKRSPFFPPSCSFSVFFIILSSNLDLLSICPFHTIFLSLHHHHHRACFGYERSWNSRAQI